MAKRNEQGKLEDLIRRQGMPQTARIETLVPEVRSCIVATRMKATAPRSEATLGGLVVIWEYSLPLSEARGFHNNLRRDEEYIAASLKKLGKSNPYSGTYMLYGPGNPTYRTIWRYESLEAMDALWRTALGDKSSRLYVALRQLRSYWLRDPQRAEARWVPASGYLHDEDKDGGDAFAKLTLDAAEAMGSSSANPPPAAGAKRKAR
jgi:hypothetical protein